VEVVTYEGISRVEKGKKTEHGVKPRNCAEGKAKTAAALKVFGTRSGAWDFLPWGGDEGRPRGSKTNQKLNSSQTREGLIGLRSGGFCLAKGELGMIRKKHFTAV